MSDNIDLDHLKEYLKTPAGCDGGNINGKNWVFSIERAAGENENVYRNIIIDQNHKYIEKSNVEKFIKSHPFNQRIAKYEAVKHGRNIEEYLEFAIDSNMFTNDSEYYKGNLGAFEFRHDDEESFKNIGVLSKFQTKEEWKEYEIDIRAEMFRAWVKKYSPNCISCFGLGNRERFIKAFSDVTEKKENRIKLGDYIYYHDIVNEGKTNLFILPHPTAKSGKGMTDNDTISIYGKMVRETMKANNFIVY